MFNRIREVEKPSFYDFGVSWCCLLAAGGKSSKTGKTSYTELQNGLEYQINFFASVFAMVDLVKTGIFSVL